MAVQTTANINSSISWTQIDTQTLTTISDSGSVGLDKILSDGSGNEQINAIWHQSIVLPSGGSHSINLQSVYKELFDQSSVMSFTNVKGISISNINENLGANILVSITGSDGLSGVYYNSYGQSFCGPKSSVTFNNIMNGWNITSSHRRITLRDIAGSGCTVEVVAIGVSG